MAIILLLLAVVIIVSISAIINGWALLHLWQWFIVPLGVPSLTLSWAIGISLVVGLLTNHNYPKKGEESDTSQVAYMIFLRPILALVVG